MNQNQVITLTDRLNLSTGLSGIFMYEPLDIGQLVRVEQSTYCVARSYLLKVRYYPKTNRLAFVYGAVRVNDVSKVLKFLGETGFYSVSQFCRVHMSCSKQAESHIYKDLYFNSFNRFSIFDM